MFTNRLTRFEITDILLLINRLAQFMLDDLDRPTRLKMFQRNTKLDPTFSYTIGQNALRISVEGLSDINPVTKRIKFLPARFFNRTTDQKTLLPLVGSNRAFFRSRQSPQHWCAGKRGLSSTHLRAERGGGSTAELGSARVSRPSSPLHKEINK